jgi:outer membrane lipoprotein-sorting protein
MKKSLLIALVGLLSVFIVSAQDAAAIMDSARQRLQTETMATRSRMVITSRSGSTIEQTLEQYSKDGPRGARTVVVFQSPTDVAGMGFLIMDTATGGSDNWIYLPSLGKVRRIAASESSGSFMGTDFSYDDVSFMSRATDRDTHSILREETLNQRACYVIQSLPRDTNGPYSRTLTWVDKSSSLIYKSELYDRRGSLLKIMEMSDYREVQGQLTPMQTRVTTVAAGTFTTIFIDAIRYNSPIPESVFTTAFLETGRAAR